MSALYDKARQAALAAIWTGTIKAVFVDGADYTPDLAVDEFFSSVPGGALVGTPQTISGLSVTAGVADGADIVFPTLTGDPPEYLLLYQDTGNPATSRLLALIDVFGLTPGGLDVTVQWSDGPTRIFKL